MGDGQRLGQHVQQGGLELGLARPQARLDQLEVPVAQLAVDEVVQAERGVGEVVALDPPVDLGPGALEAREDPAVLDRRRRRRRAHVRPHPEQDQPSGVPQLVRELQALGEPLLAEADVLGRGHDVQAPADGVRAVGRELTAALEHGRPRPALDQVERVDPGAERLRHPPAVGRLDDRVHVDVGERHLAAELDPQHDHPRHPQEDDVPAGDQHVGRIEGAQRRRVVRPAQRGEREQRPS